MSDRQPSATPRKKRPKIGLALAGGGPLAAVYEIGALAAIQEAIPGLDLNGADIYIGISAGGLVASGLANGITPHQMCRLFIESDAGAESDPDLFRPELMMRPATGEICARMASVPMLLATGLFEYARQRGSVMAAFERLKQALPAGVVSGEGIHKYLSAAFSQPGRTNDFRALRKKLVIVATDLDTGEAVCFGAKGRDDTPISRAVQASAAVPGLFPPVEIGGHYYVDGALRKTLHASIALEAGADLVLCVNPIVPYNALKHHAPGALARAGLLGVLSQTLRSILHSRVEIGMHNYRKTYPERDIILLQPSMDDAELFFTNIFSYATRRRMCEQAYQNTRMMLLQRRAEIGAKLARHGLALKESVLRDTSLTLVKHPSAGGPLDRLVATLDDLDRYLKVAHS
ncbi:patatin-like phospholipase family protein [Massilia sp. TS11]|uniref:patatin-like phospholipase family protein n=1 Tax=Massilia sp. TS11 TaxID=2908003 RepID=UPI001EDBDB03|nr:patatin-like phospholipase family protein [Massilia sp. TS11]MCG2584418.1 patatin-like phospholipase family protein [Massilia sp. TS11]